jgi:hypothetical protein
MAVKNLPSITFVFVVLQLRFIVHKKLSGNLSPTDALYPFDCSRVFSITGWLVYVLHLVFNVIFSCL